ncbi:MAG TPA: B12-binding domain-containing radical SAM protein [Thermodesulfovibrionales bacterium]|nr:B12-binding domain-containing radical SAM protein [Thermodesulfovibrionales bacterium]
MRLKILLVNPWIYDFAAFNFWARPLGLLQVAEYLSPFDAETALIDCTDSFRPKDNGSGKFRTEIIEKPALLREVPRFYKRYGISIEEFLFRVKAAMPFDMVMMTSMMSYWYPGVQKATEIIRGVAGAVPIILGGVYPTLYHEHAAETSGADFIYRGSIEEGLLFALSTFGFRLKRKGARSPCYRLNLYGEYPYASLVTATGCPFHCPYCASGLLASAHKKRFPGDVIEEIAHLSEAGVRDFAFYDDALLVDSDSHFKPILRSLIATGIEARFHAPNGLHARFLDQELAALMKMVDFKTLRLGLESVDRERQKSTGGKVDTEEISRAVRYLRNAGFTKREMGVYLMYGLPAQELEEVKEGIGFLKSLEVSIHLSEFSPIRGTRYWDELVGAGIIHDGLDPLLTNNSVFSFLHSKYDSGDVEKMRLDLKRYNSES